MKKLITLSALILCIFSVSYAQVEFNTLYKECKKKDEVTCLSLPGWLMRSFNNDDMELNTIKNVRKMKLITTKDQEIKNYLTSKIDNELYSDLAIIREGNEVVKIKARFEEETIRELIISITENYEFVLISLKGNFKIQDISQLYTHQANVYHN